MKCTYCGKKIWYWQKRSPEADGQYIHSDGTYKKPCCKWDKIADATRKREETEKNRKNRK